jgi:hypothetical protein
MISADYYLHRRVYFLEVMLRVLYTHMAIEQKDKAEDWVRNELHEIMQGILDERSSYLACPR